MNEAFMIVEVNIQRNEDVIVNGRSYIDIRLGDILYAEKINQGVSSHIPYTVEKLVSYGRETPVLSTLMTGSILLKGTDFKLIKSIKMLYKE